MPKFRKKPVVINAVQMTAVDFNWKDGFDGSPFEPYEDWVEEAIVNQVLVPGTPNNTDYAQWKVRTLEGDHWGSPGDWLIQGVQGELYFCKPDIFEQTYKRVEE